MFKINILLNLVLRVFKKNNNKIVGFFSKTNKTFKNLFKKAKNKNFKD